VQAGWRIGAICMTPTLTGVGATIGTLLGVTNAAWTFWNAYRDRPNLRVDVYWEWNEGPDDQSSPHIEVVNVGARAAYIDRIDLLEANGARHLIGKFDNQEIKPDQKFLYGPSWDEPSDNDPQFYHEWNGLRVVVRNTRGKEWRSKAATTRPKWFVIQDKPKVF
jgi:hypothetical protein